MEDEHKANDVGYGKPPKHSQFKKGKSGNPMGRPPRPKPPNDLRAMLERVANEEIEINGQMMSMAEVELRSIQRKAAKGDVSASRHLAKLRADAGLVNHSKAAAEFWLCPACGLSTNGRFPPRSSRRHSGSNPRMTNERALGGGRLSSLQPIREVRRKAQNAR